VVTTKPVQQLIQARSLRVPGSAQKARLVADLVRDEPVVDALARLKFVQRSSAHHIAKTIKSAVANAEENHGLERSNLYIHTLLVDVGPSRRWRRFGARGRFKPIIRRTTHITVKLAEFDE